MTIGIYSITHRESGKRYIGKSKHVEVRIRQHKRLLVKPSRSKSCNRHLWNAVHKYGWENFDIAIVEHFYIVDETYIAERELFWIEHFRTFDRAFGYNLRIDSSTGMIVLAETRDIISTANKEAWRVDALRRHESSAAMKLRWTNEGYRESISDMLKKSHANGAFGEETRNKIGIKAKDRLSDPAKRAAISENARRNHAAGRYDENTRRKIGEASKATWANPEKRAQYIASGKRSRENPAYRRNQSEKSQKYQFLQYDLDGTFIRHWSSVKAIVAVNDNCKLHGIYNACKGRTKSHGGFLWKQELIDKNIREVVA